MSTTNKNLVQIKMDIKLAENVFGKENVFWDNDFNWIMIKNFKLPEIFNQRYTNCLIILPPGYGYGTKLEEFYLNKDLKVKKNTSYSSLPHYYRDNIKKGHSYLSKNWQWLCIHPHWEKGDSLLSFLKQIEIFLKWPFETTMT